MKSLFTLGLLLSALPTVVHAECFQSTGCTFVVSGNDAGTDTENPPYFIPSPLPPGYIPNTTYVGVSRCIFFPDGQECFDTYIATPPNNRAANMNFAEYVQCVGKNQKGETDNAQGFKLLVNKCGNQYQIYKVTVEFRDVNFVPTTITHLTQVPLGVNCGERAVSEEKCAL